MRDFFLKETLKKKQHIFTVRNVTKCLYVLVCFVQVGTSSRDSSSVWTGPGSLWRKSTTWWTRRTSSWRWCSGGEATWERRLSSVSLFRLSLSLFLSDPRGHALRFFFWHVSIRGSQLSVHHFGADWNISTTVDGLPQRRADVSCLHGCSQIDNLSLLPFLWHSFKLPLLYISVNDCQ